MSTVALSDESGKARGRGMPSTAFYVVLAILCAFVGYLGYVLFGGPIAAAVSTVAAAACCALLVVGLTALNRFFERHPLEQHPTVQAWLAGLFYALLAAFSIWFLIFSSDRDAVRYRQAFVAIFHWCAAILFGVIAGVDTAVSQAFTLRGLLIVIALLLFGILQQLVRMNRRR